MEAALYVPSGNMGNHCDLEAHTHPGEKVLFEASNHLFLVERLPNAHAACVVPHPLEGEFGVLKPEQVEDAAAATTSVPASQVCIENSHNVSGGMAVLPEEVRALAEAAHDHLMRVHLDGARIFNAAISLDIDVRELTRHVDSVMFCLSKGLSAPVGSMLCGSHDFVDRATQVRKWLGGGMRKAGMMAAAGIVALESMVERLAEDGRRAHALCQKLGEVEGVVASQPPRPTNFVLVDVAGLGWTSDELVTRWRERGILAGSRPPASARLVTHRHISDADVEFSVEVTRELVQEGPMGA
jgi:threonine aldolase